MPAATRSINPFRTLARHRNFRLFWLGQTTSLIGTWMQQVAIGWLALELSNDPFLVGLVSAAGTFPILILSLPAGVLADRTEKLRMVKIAQLFMLIEASLLWWFAWSGKMTIEWLLGLALFGGTLSAFEIPARQSLIVDLVVKEDLQDAIALNSGGFNLARILGPTVAALVIAQFGLAWCFGFNALSYLAVIIGLAMIRLPVRRALRAQHHPSPFDGLMEALRYVRNDRLMWIIMRIVAVFSVLGIPVLTLLPVMARDHLHLDVSGYGALMMCYGVGALFGALVIASQGAQLPRGALLRVTSIGLGVAIVAFTLSRSPVFAGTMLFVTGIAMISNNAIINGLLQQRVPDRLRGRVMALYVTVYVGMNPVGSFLAGCIARQSSAAWSIGGMAGVMVLFAIWAFRRYPELRDA
ncbi:MAG TPA: MFS transporter [Gemmatimonadaceae bacterium]|nr:MFS transporter [Gemmatimonadaceae bacterium]